MSLKQYLDTKNENGADFAVRVGCHASTISRILNGTRNPSGTLARKIEAATARQVTIDQLIKPLKPSSKIIKPKPSGANEARP